jgi:hypothetical protein
MFEAEMLDDRILSTLKESIEAWVCRGNGQPLVRWLNREIDRDGLPARLSLPRWRECLIRLAPRGRSQPSWPAECQEEIVRLISATLRFTRRDSSFATDMVEQGHALDANGSIESAPATGRWIAGRKRALESTMLEAWSSSKRVLAILRADADAGADFAVVDHRVGSADCRFELYGAGETWLGPAWSTGAPDAAGGRPRRLLWEAAEDAILSEWSTRSGDARLTYSVALLRAHRLALLSVLAVGLEASSARFNTRIAYPRQLKAEAVPGSRAIRLVGPRASRSAVVVPLALPARPYASERGSFEEHSGSLVLEQQGDSRRLWLPLLVSWDHARHKQELFWRTLTVTEKSRIVGADRAFAARVSWGRKETYVIYKSIGPVAVRAFLGHHTRARFMIGRFTSEGAVEPILEIP